MGTRLKHSATGLAKNYVITEGEKTSHWWGKVSLVFEAASGLPTLNCGGRGWHKVPLSDIRPIMSQADSRTIPFHSIPYQTIANHTLQKQNKSKAMMPLSDISPIMSQG